MKSNTKHLIGLALAFFVGFMASKAFDRIPAKPLEMDNNESEVQSSGQQKGLDKFNNRE